MGGGESFLRWRISRVCSRIKGEINCRQEKRRVKNNRGGFNRVVIGKRSREIRMTLLWFAVDSEEHRKLKERGAIKNNNIYVFSQTYRYL